ncbi:hypothetical protein [Pseudalkalibacillus salsuginis]|uniref:hypothetical protein n=1 Tax=Pseudalkalibacillus salsuginis TaxID=2910972 RepID=UPI001F460223|nr:hypothetical protein [Pseudalkalibacillus salsuginis]MCF6410684.1 hypothetical protein [Pseudalkalibacillus salsuginis]
MVSTHKKNIQFKKPLIMVDEDRYLPDFILDKNLPHIIIEVAGLLNDDEYKSHLELKEKHYREKGYQYVEWDPRKDLREIFNKVEF